MIVLDTNVVSELMKVEPDLRVRNWLIGLGNHPLATSTVTFAEITYGLTRLPEGRRRTDLEGRFEIFARAMTILPLDEAAGRLAGRFRALREAEGLAAQPSDMMIAAIASRAGSLLATRNLRDFAGLPLETADPWLSQ